MGCNAIQLGLYSGSDCTVQQLQSWTHTVLYVLPQLMNYECHLTFDCNILFFDMFSVPTAV